jgi:hypothetical protein
MRAALLLLVVAAAACGGKGKTDTAQPGSEAQGTPEQAVLDRFEALDDEVEKSRGRCPRLAGAIDAWLAANAGPVRELIEKSRAEPRLDGGLLERVEQHLERIFDRVLDAATTCQGKGGVDQAFARLDAFLEAT